MSAISLVFSIERMCLRSRTRVATPIETEIAGELTGALGQSRALLLGVLLRLPTTLFHPIAHHTKYGDCKEGHPPLLVWLEGLVERRSLPSA